MQMKKKKHYCPRSTQKNIKPFETITKCTKKIKKKVTKCD